MKKKKKHISGSEAFLKKQKQKQKNKPDRLKIGLIVFTFVLSAVFAVASGLFLKDHIHRKNHCTAEIVGEITNASTWRTGGRRHKYHGKADVVVKSDGVFPSQTIHTTSYYIAKQKSVKIFYDPENTKEYYFESKFADSRSLSILFAVLSVIELLFGIAITKAYLRSKQRQKR